MTERFDRQFLDQIRERVPLASAIGARVKLTRKGHEHGGLCPFHNEKTPSFTVNEDKGFFHCFGCGAHGDVIGWTMRVRNVSFPDAVEDLAQQAGLELPRKLAAESEEDRKAAQRAASIYEACEAACVWFEAQLRGANPLAQRAATYLLDRGISAGTVARFRLGWAPKSYDALRQALPLDKYPEDLLIEAGLRHKTAKGSRMDQFRGRIMIPITDKRGRVVGFGARVLPALTGETEDEPKYLNSPATPIFNKGELLYGYALARAGLAKRRDLAEAAASADVNDAPAVDDDGIAAKIGALPLGKRPVVVEGYFDVIAMHQAGIDTAVAPLGTALTEDQLRLLWRLGPSPVLALDGDAAGARAMERAMERAIDMLSERQTLAFARLPGKDPAALLESGQVGLLKLRVALARPALMIHALWEMLRARHHEDGPEQAITFERAVLAAASRIPDGVTRAYYLAEYRHRLRVGDWRGTPKIFIGRSTKNTAPAPCDDWVLGMWESARRKEPRREVDGWLRKMGVDVAGLEKRLGGVGFMRGKMVKGRYEDGGAWPDAPRPALWQWDDDVSLVIIPDWDGIPGESALLDLVGWDARTGAFGTLTGHTIVLGRVAIDTTIGYEARGLAHPLIVAETPLSWLRRTATGEHCALLIDHRRAWEAIGGLRAVAAETLEHGELLEKLLVPPELRRPTIGIENSPAQAPAEEAGQAA